MTADILHIIKKKYAEVEFNFSLQRLKKYVKKCLTVWSEGGNINKLSRSGSPLGLFLPPHGSGQAIKKKKKGLDKESKVW